MKNHLSYQQRIDYFTNPTAQRLLQLMEDKKTNLCLSLDITTGDELLQLVDKLGSEICLLKTHIDILTDFNLLFLQTLQSLANKHQFLIFEDRKFADIGHTVQLQYKSGMYRMVEWADIVNAHILPGPGIIEGLKKIGLPQGRGLLLLAQMSAKENLLDANYTQAAIQLADKYKEFVIGFIAIQSIVTHPGYLQLTPGIHLSAKKDNYGQQYIDPTQAVLENGTDIIIVGRGIYAATDPLASAKQYRHIGWQAYKKRINQL